MWFPWGKLMAFWNAGKSKRHPEKEFCWVGKKPKYSSIEWNSLKKFSNEIFVFSLEENMPTLHGKNLEQPQVPGWDTQLDYGESKQEHTHLNLDSKPRTHCKTPPRALCMVWHNTEPGKKEPGKDVSTWILPHCRDIAKSMLMWVNIWKLQQQFRSCSEFSWNHGMSEVGRDLVQLLLTSATQSPEPCPGAFWVWQKQKTSYSVLLFIPWREVMRYKYIKNL